MVRVTDCLLIWAMFYVLPLMDLLRVCMCVKGSGLEELLYRLSFLSVCACLLADVPKQLTM